MLIIINSVCFFILCNKIIKSQQGQQTQLMKLRANRTHFSGTSNRLKQHSINSISINKGSQMLQKSYNKSQSLYYKTSVFQQTSQSQKPNEGDKTSKPFLGTHSQFQTARFNPNSIKPYNYPKMRIPQLKHTLQLKQLANKNVKDIKSEFEGKDINMHKLSQLKHAFLTNNRQRKNIKQYFKRFANEEQVIDKNGIKMIVKEFGFDANDDQIDMLMRLTNREAKQGLNMNSFIDLMTKQNVYFNTMNFDRKQFQEQSFFSPKIHEILRNKFYKLKQAFKIYASRGQEVDQQKFHYVMKKLDLTNLVLSPYQRLQIYDRFADQRGIFNPEGLICLIAQQQNARIKGQKISQHHQFDDQLKVNQQKKFEKEKQLNPFNLKNASSLEYQNNLSRALFILRQLRHLNNNKNVMAQIMKQNQLSKIQLKENIQIFLQKQGFNFQKKQYEAFIGYLDFNKDGKINQDLARKFIIEQQQSEGQARIERKVRVPPPKYEKYNHQHGFDIKAAHQCLKKIHDFKMNPEMKSLFDRFDSDKDGYVSNQEFKKGVSQMHLLQGWEIDNLAAYMDQQSKGYLTYKGFSQKFDVKQELPLVNPNKMKSQSCSEWTSTRKKFINTNKKYIYNCPSKYSAWPERLKESDLSLIQPPQKSGLYQSESDRFQCIEKNNIGQNDKQRKQRIYENKLKRVSEWQQKNQQNIKSVDKRHEDKAASRNYFLRLAKQIYQHNCHP